MTPTHLIAEALMIGGPLLALWAAWPRQAARKAVWRALRGARAL